MNPSFARRLLLLVFPGFCAVLFSPNAAGYALENKSWPSGTIVTMQMELGSPGQMLQDGSTTWNLAAAPSIDAWNAQMGNIQIAAVMDSTKPISSGRWDQFRLLFFHCFRRFLRQRRAGGDLLPIARHHHDGS